METRCFFSSRQILGVKVLQQKWYCVWLIPDIAHTSIVSKEISPSPAVNDPFSLPCFSDIENQLVPSDAADFVKITYTWRLLTDGNLYNLADVAKDPSRLQINPISGKIKKIVKIFVFFETFVHSKATLYNKTE